MPTASKTRTLAELRAHIARIETGQTGEAGDSGRHVFSTGVPALDRALPWPGLPRGATHEFLSAGPKDGAATGFVIGLLGRLLVGLAPDAPILWAGGRDDLYGPGLARLGLDPGRLLMARCRTGQETLWALEEGLRCPTLAAVVGEVGSLDFGPSRRLQLAAVESGTPLLLLRPYLRDWDRKAEGADLPPSAAVTRWRIESRTSSCLEPALLETMIGNPRWHLALLRCRGGKPQHWMIECDDETGALSVAAPAGDRSYRQSAA